MMHSQYLPLTRNAAAVTGGPWLQRRSRGGPMPSTVPGSVTEVLRGPGQPLAADVRGFAEPRLGQDFSGVRVHADDAAARSARDVNALAYTLGWDVVFGAGQYRPGDASGRRLIAHELAHVVQQSRGGATPAQDRTLEAEAEAAADVLQAGGRAGIEGAGALGVARVVGPQSLDHAVDPASMTTAEIQTEIGRIERWLQDNKSGPQSQQLAATLGRLKEELARRPAASAGKPAEPDTGNAINLRLRLPAVRSADAGAGAGAPLGAADQSSINTPPPATKPGPSLESLLPRQPDAAGPQTRPPQAAPSAEKPATAGTPAATTTKADADDKPGAGLQAGAGEQTNLRGPHQAFGYVQVSAEWSNKYATGLKVPEALSGIIKSINLVGEPGLTLQLHAAGDSPGQVDAQFLMTLAQLSLQHIDLSAVAGAGYNDVFKTPAWSRLAPLGGVEVEPKIGKLGPVEISWVLNGLFTYSVPGLPANAPKASPPPSRRPDGQFSGELRLKIDL
jgi:hypothetical protein